MMNMRIASHRTTLILAGLIALTVSGCSMQAGGSVGGTAGTIARLEPLVDNCDGPLNAYGGLDFSASGRGDHELLDERLRAMDDIAEQVAACGGFMKVVGFSSSPARTFTLGEAEFPTSFGTQNARLIQGGETAESLADEVNDSLASAERHLNPNGSDVLAQLTLAAEYQAQRQDGSLYVELATDGIATTKPVVMNTPEFTDTVARSAARSVELPDLSGTEIRIAGIGRAAGSRQLGATRIGAIKAFYEIACNRTHANCLVTTDYTQGG